MPGFIKFFDPNGEVVKTTNFPSGGEYSYNDNPGAIDEYGNRGTTLGLNMLVLQKFYNNYVNLFILCNYFIFYL